MDTLRLDLNEWNMRELSDLADVLNAWYSGGLPTFFSEYHVEAVCSYGEVFLQNGEGQIAQIDSADGELKIWHIIPSGSDGFLCDLMAESDPNDLSWRDVRYIEEAPEFAALVATGDYPAWDPDREEEEEEEEEEDEE